MGYLLKEALKTLCGVNRWSYAVFWKIGCQNSRLLIWEECYYHTLPCSSDPPRGHDNCDSPFGAVPPEDLPCQSLIQAEDKLQSLTNVMMNSNQICLVGEGIIGRAAFTGNYQWFLSNSCSTDVHPPEVSNEMHHQFSSGIQTVAVIPVSPHGVVQLGSSFSAGSSHSIDTTKLLHNQLNQFPISALPSSQYLGIVCAVLIAENLGFVNDVKSLILQLGCIPGALFSLDSSENSRLSGYPGRGLTDTSEVCRLTTSNNLVVDSCKQLRNSSYRSRLISGQSDSLARKFQHNSSITSSASRSPLPPLEEASFYPRGQVERGEVRAEVICRNPDKKLNQYIVSGKVYHGESLQAAQDQLCVQRYIQPIQKQMPVALAAQNPVHRKSSDLNSMIITSGMRRQSCSELDSSKAVDSSRFRGGGELLSEPSISDLTDVGFQTGDLTELEGIPLFSLSKQLMTYPTEVISGGSNLINHPLGIYHPHLDSVSKSQRMETDSTLAPNLPWTYLKEENPCPGDDIHVTVSQNLNNEDSFEQSEGDGLFDILGMDMKNKIFGGRFGSADLPKFSAGILKSIDTQEADQDLPLVDKGLSEGGFFSTTGNDHLLDAVVSGAHSASKQNSDDSLSCKSTLTRISSHSQPSSSLAYCQSNTISKVQEDSLGHPEKEGTLGSGSLRSGCTKNNGAACSEGNSLCSQLRAWTDQSHAMKRDNSILAAHSEGLDEAKKPSRKRLKPGENPKPRPKDRQMIQDRLKELRDIVPNGAKCSIDALLERTVKHMLFLQGVRKHVDNLEHIGESRMMDKEGRLFLKDNFEGGATWAYEIGSQSMACPIIVEDLNPPRQLLVEMLCEDRGFFLEIADIIRTLGLTILTGVMESRNENIWARFAVEANRDVTRMEVFMSLVRALEEIMKGDSMPETAIRNHLTPHH